MKPEPFKVRLDNSGESYSPGDRIYTERDYHGKVQFDDVARVYDRSKIELLAQAPVMVEVIKGLLKKLQDIGEDEYSDKQRYDDEEVVMLARHVLAKVHTVIA